MMGFWGWVNFGSRARSDTDEPAATGDCAPTPTTLTEDRILAQVERIAADDGIADSAKLIEFLRFVVTETLAGRGDRLTGRVIGQEVYGRGVDFDPQQESIVRVEAGRLRRRLAVYYAGAGRRDPIRIAIPKGHYVPTFEVAAPPGRASDANETEPGSRSRSLRAPIAAAVVALIAIGLGGYQLSRDSGPDATPYGRGFTASSEAFALFLETQGVRKPPTNRERVEAAIDLAREVVRLDPQFAGGYASESFSLWAYVVFGHSSTPAEHAARALELAEKAVLLQPDFAFGFQSLSRARHLTGDLAGAIDAARRAVDLQPAMAELQGNLGILLVFVGRPGEAIAPVQEAIRLSGDGVRVPFFNHLALANFHAGLPEKTIETIESNRARGGPMGPHLHLYAAAAYSELGRLADARDAVAMIKGAGHTSVVEAWLEYALVDDAARRQLAAALDRVGLNVRRPMGKDGILGLRNP